jgi:cytochrome P450
MPMGGLMAFAFEPFAPELRRDPFPAYRELRDRAPLHFAPGAGAWCVSRYDDVLHVLKSPELFSSRAMFTMVINGGKEGLPLSWDVLRMVVVFLLRTRLNPLQFPKARALISVDPPVHGGMRRLVNRGFTPRRIAEWEARMREIVDAQLAGLRRGDAFDVVEDLAIPLPVTIIAEMLGVDPARRADFKRWSDSFIESSTGRGRARPFAPEFVDSFSQFARFLRGVVKERRRAPGDDLISAIVAEDPEGGEPLSDLETLAFVQLLLVAGNETTTNLIGNAVHALLAHRDQLALVRGDPARVPAALEETLRFDSPIQLVFRNATREVELSGGRIPAGGIVAVLLGSANRDERRFPDPDRFDVGRDTGGHLAFGFGNHFCLGASLARLEARVALEALLPELPRLEPAGRERELIDSFLVRGPRRLALRRAA